jgi:predicted small secreted protein
MKMNKRLRPLLALLLLGVLASCGTVEGVGRDISGASRRVSDML